MKCGEHFYDLIASIMFSQERKKRKNIKLYTNIDATNCIRIKQWKWNTETEQWENLAS